MINNHIVFVNSSFNNTIITLCDSKGKTLAWSSPGVCKFKGTKKSTPFATQVATESLFGSLRKHNVKFLDIRVKGPGVGRDVVIRTINNMGIKIISIFDITPIPHNGCRPKKKRRV